MIDLNTLISNALTAAINSAVAPLNARIAALESANDILHRVQHEDMVAMRDRIAALESVCTTQHNDMVTMRVRISALEAKTNEANMAKFVEGETLAALAVTDIVGEDRVAQIESRIAALEDQAIVTSNAVDTRITALENNPAQGADTQTTQYTLLSKEQFKAMLQELATKDALIDYLNEQEWFWDKMRNFIDAAIEQAVDNHCETYDHDSYDSAVSDLEDRDFDDYVTSDSLEDAVREAVGNLSFDISVS